MSLLKHATLSKWNRAEDGSYEAEIAGWTLKVAWRPQRGDEPRGFTWTAKKGDAKLSGRDVHEEIETAMVDAETVTGEADTEGAVPKH